ncbi:MAG TPA: hypothetical protein VLU38_06355 [Methanomassiliicoccales archaeon]|nr:hypothetical protein [Methanomassiliicoccales archaeon]
MEAENQGLNTRDVLKIVLFIAIAVVLLIVILGIFGFLTQSQYGFP